MKMHKVKHNNTRKPRPDTRRNTDPRRPEPVKGVSWHGELHTDSFELPTPISTRETV